jgi:hypothetical protein
MNLNLQKRIVFKLKNNIYPYIRLLLFLYISLLIYYPNNTTNRFIVSLINIKEVKILIIISALYIANINYPISILLIILLVIVQLINYKFYKNNIDAYENVKLKYNYLNNNNIDIDSNQTNIYNKKNKNITIVDNISPVISADNILIN